MKNSNSGSLLTQSKVYWWRWNDGSLKQKLNWKVNRWRRLLSGDHSVTTLPYDWRYTPQRWQLIQEVISRNKYRKYLEIGCYDDACFDNIKCEVKVGVDPESGGTIRKTSDEFFAVNNDQFDCVFIDGLHTYEQVRKDINNSLACLTAGGIIFIHDCLPCSIGEQAVPREQVDWSGDVWKALVEQRTQDGVDVATCVIDRGVGVILKRESGSCLKSENSRDFKGLKFKEYASKHQQWMNPIDFSEIFNFIDNKRA